MGAAFAGGLLLSDEQRLTRHVRPRTTAPVRDRPAHGARRVDRLKLLTEDGVAETYLALRTAVDANGAGWVELRLPRRPNGRTGWVPRAALGTFRIVHTHLRINRTTLTATLYERGRAVWRSRIGVGARATPTPAGRFVVRELLRVPDPGGTYGPWAFGTSAYSALSDWPGGGVVGIHGTDEPELIPGRPSHGCVRIPNAAIARLARLMPVGTPVRIL